MRALVLVGLLSACGPRVVAPQGTDADGSATSDDTASSSTSGVPVTTTSSSEASTTTDADGTSSTSTTELDSLGFIPPTDANGSNLDCSIWNEDCPPGEKCMPWSNDGEPSWNATRCSPLAEDPVGPGEACTVEGSGVSGIDDCESHSMCWHVDPETNEGTCVSFCGGTERSPICADPITECLIEKEGVLPLCLPVCDPLAQDCSDGEGCFPSDGFFWCLPDAQFPGPGDPCVEFCTPGLACIDGSRVPNCMGDSCCSEFCDLQDRDPLCYFEGQICEPWFEPGATPPGYDHVGVCAVPA